MAHFYTIYTILFGLMMDTAQTAPLERQKRFLTPFPVPTLPHIVVTPATQVVLTGSFLLSNSRPVSCPTKRSKRSARYRRVALKNGLMSELYGHLVGELNKTMMASSLEEADDNFVHLSETNRLMQTTTEPNGTVLKRVFLDDVKTLNKWRDAVMKRVRHNSTDNYRQAEMTLSDLLESVGLTTTQLKQLLNIKSDLSEVSKYNAVKGRRTRDVPAPGLFSYKQYCTRRGQSTGDGYIHLCTTCAWSTQLAPDRYPRVINEASCDKSDCNCFTINGTPHGKCQEMVQHVKVLRRKPGACRLLIHNGTRVIIDDWELYDQPTRVGCECVLNKKSMFAKYVGSGPQSPVVG